MSESFIGLFILLQMAIIYDIFKRISPGKVMALNHNILLESGTNEFEIVEFVINGDRSYHFCINVAKVREVIVFPEIVQVPDAHEAIIGTANIRQKLVPIINLGRWLGVAQSVHTEKSKVIVTYFNGAYNGFLVDDVVRIHRITWGDIKDYSSITDFPLVDSVLGVITIDGRLVQLIDFESIVAEINPTTMSKEEANIDMSLIQARKGKLVYMAEDSLTIRKLLKTNFTKAGYDISIFENGHELLMALQNKLPDIIVTDLEMPGTSGDYVVRKVREKNQLAAIPIIVFSSMASEENERKLKSIGANMFIGKPELSFLIKSVDGFILNK